jgi:hypothetical protein
VIKHTIAVCESLQEEAGNLKWATLSKVLENLAGILRKYDEDRFRSLPTKTKRLVVHAMGRALERSLDFTDQTIALLQEHQRESGPKGGHGVEDTQVSQYSRVGRCITNLAEVASQFDGSVVASHPISEIPVANLNHPVLCLYLIKTLSLGYTKTKKHQTQASRQRHLLPRLPLRDVALP